MLEFLKVLVIGIVEGLTEWLPISSTGHMILVDELVQLNVSADFREVFLVVIQLGAILAVVVLYFNRLNPFARGKSRAARRRCLRLWAKIIIACLPAAVAGLLLDDWMDAHLYNSVVVALMLILYGVAFIVLERRNARKKFKIRGTAAISYRTAFLTGLFQVLALVPGTSRSGATILGAMLLGCSRACAAEFSFFLGIPVMFGASLLKLLKHGLIFAPVEYFYLLTGMTVAFFVAVLSIRFLMDFVKKHDFSYFGIYRIVLGVIVLAWFGIKAVMA